MFRPESVIFAVIPFVCVGFYSGTGQAMVKTFCGTTDATTAALQIIIGTK